MISPPYLLEQPPQLGVSVSVWPLSTSHRDGRRAIHRMQGTTATWRSWRARDGAEARARRQRFASVTRYPTSACISGEL
jgi:hypothetical protein